MTGSSIIEFRAADHGGFQLDLSNGDVSYFPDFDELYWSNVLVSAYTGMLSGLQTLTGLPGVRASIPVNAAMQLVNLTAALERAENASSPREAFQELARHDPYSPDFRLQLDRHSDFFDDQH